MRAQRRRATVRDSGKRGATTQALRRARSSQGTIGLLHLSVKPFYVNITPRDEIEHTRRNKGKHTRYAEVSAKAAEEDLGVPLQPPQRPLRLRNWMETQGLNFEVIAREGEARTGVL